MANVILSFCICFFAAFGSASSTENALLNAVTGTLTFTLENDHLIDTNLLFGITIVAGQLEVMMQYDLNDDWLLKINHLKMLCQSIFKRVVEENMTDTRINNTPELLFSPEMWAFDNFPTHLMKRWDLNLKWPTQDIQGDQPEDEFQFRQEYENCLKTLLKNCYFSEHCFNQMIKRRSKKYISTHQILYLQTMKQTLQKNLCSLDSISLDVEDLNEIMNQKCVEVYQEAQHLEKQIRAGQRNALVDLLLEEVVVCGLQNYDEFFSRCYLDLILEDDFPFVNESDENLMDNNHGIDSAIHLLSVRAVARILYLKRILYNWMGLTRQSLNLL